MRYLENAALAGRDRIALDERRCFADLRQRAGSARGVDGAGPVMAVAWIAADLILKDS